MRSPVKRFTILVVVLSLLLMGCATIPVGKERLLDPPEKRHGVTLTVKTIYGEKIKGELIEVKEHDVLVIENESKEVKIYSSDIYSIKIPRKSKFWKGAGLGALTGFGVTLLADSYQYIVTKSHIPFSYWKDPIIFGTLIGMIAGVGYGMDATIKLKDKSLEEVFLILYNLSKLSRNYRES